MASRRGDQPSASQTLLNLPELAMHMTGYTWQCTGVNYLGVHDEAKMTGDCSSRNIMASILTLSHFG